VTAAGRPTVPRLHPKARLQHDDVRGRDVLLYPEGLVALNPTGAEILVLCDEAQGVLRITRRLGEPVLEVLQPRGIHPLVVAQHRRQPLLHDQRREHFGERGRHRLEPGPEPAEAHVRVHGEAHAGQKKTLADQILALHAHRFAQPQPRLDAAFLPRPTIVIDDPLDPLLAHLPLGAARQDQGILDGDADLIVEAVRHPQLQLLARQLAPVHPLVERVEVVVAALQYTPQTADQSVHRR